MRALRVLGLVCCSNLIAASACAPPDGVQSLRDAQAAFGKLDHFTVSWTTTTRLGSFVDTNEFDCTKMYSHAHATRDFNATGLEEGSSLSQGRPLAHSETDQLFVDGRSYQRVSPYWERPDQNDPERWVPVSASFDPATSCQGLQAGTDFALVPFKQMLARPAISYVGSRTVNGMSCRAFDVTYPEPTYSDKMTTTDLGNGSSFSERQVVMKPIKATICLDSASSLPVQSVTPDKTITFSYGAVVAISPVG